MPRAWEFVRKKLREGRQAYVVCPRIGSEDDLEFDTGSATAEAMSRELSQGELRGFRIGLIHGQQPREHRQAVMDAFREGELDVLVATTVIEVGVDVPNATLMVICQAERFGLSQLHQLRGRIGRGQHQGYCFLWSHAVDQPDATRRLAALESTSDGFQIAEVDFELRGPGDVLGTRQHGELPLRVASLVKDRDLLDEARRIAFQLVESGEIDAAEFAPLKVNVLDRFRKLMDLPQTG
jgi:ATP-dependent DNA helicase RecG